MVRRGFMLAALLAAASSAALAETRPATSLYERLGGENGVAAIVSDTVDASAALPTLRASFAGSTEEMKRQLAMRICAASGGGCRATGAVGLGELGPFLEALRVSLRSHEVPLTARNELLEVLTARQLARLQ